MGAEAGASHQKHREHLVCEQWGDPEETLMSQVSLWLWLGRETQSEQDWMQ